MSIGILILRIVVGLLFVGHGTQKLFGWWGGGGLQGTAGFFGSLGFRRPREAAIVGGVAETLGGLLLLLGFLTPLGTALIVFMMVSAILSVHVPNGMWNERGGAEFPLVMMTAAFAIALGPGRYALDRAIGFGWNHRVMATLALFVGIVGGVAAVATRTTPPAERQRPSTNARNAGPPERLPA